MMSSRKRDKFRLLTTLFSARMRETNTQNYFLHGLRRNDVKLYVLSAVAVCVCVCAYMFVRVVLVNPSLWGPNVPTKIVVPVIFDLVRTFFIFLWKNIL